MAPAKSDIAPWKWVDTKESEEITADEVHQSYRLKGTGLPICPFRCTRNCRKNPYCLWGLGEKPWISSGAEDNSDEDNNPEFRREDDFVGIINLGTTCYVNALLQLWFHNPIIRPAILKWRPSYVKEGEKYQPLCLLGQLQAMFARMKISKRSAIDPTTLIECLNLNTGEQQDAQEFAKLFMSVLSTLADEDNVRKELNRAFEGTSKYEMECKVCKAKYGTKEKFTELDLCVKDAKDTSASFTKLFTEEELSGDNQYLCQNCGGKRDAIRRFQLLSLPPVLNFQLLRFVYDKGTRSKKKVSTPYCFPEFLNMKPYTHGSNLENAVDQQFLYQLTGYLVHNGSSASSGHYVAHIRDIRTGAWLIFNDDAVSAQKSSLSAKSKTEEDLTLKSEKKGEYKSTGAYMLVYTHSTLIKTPPIDPEIPSYLKQLIVEEDALFESEFQSTKKERESKAQYLDERKACVHELYNLLLPEKVSASVVPDKENKELRDSSAASKTSRENGARNPKGNDTEHSGSIKKNKEKSTKDSKLSNTQLAASKAKSYEKRYTIDQIDFIPYTWLTSWLNHQTEKVPRLSTEEISCIHQKLLLPPGVGSVPYKVVPSEIASVLYAKYGENSTRLCGSDALCFECVKSQFRIQRSINQLDFHSKQVQELSNICLKNCDSFRKGRETINYSHNFWEDKFWVSKNSLRKWKGWARASLLPENSELGEVVEIMPEQGEQLFNEDIKCSHGNLSLEDALRRPVCVETWSILEKYFPNCYRANVQADKPCTICKDLQAQNVNIALGNKKFAEKIKDALNDLCKNKNRPDPTCTGQYYFVSETFTRRLASFLRNPEKNESPDSVANEMLLCKRHNLFKYPINLVEELKNSYSQISSFDFLGNKFNRWSLVREDEWAAIQDLFSVDHKAKVVVTADIENVTNHSYNPDLCTECSMRWFTEARAEMCQFIDEAVYFKPYDEKETDEFFRRNGGADDSCEDFFVPPSSKRKKTQESIRRSCRSRHGKREKKVLVSSDDTVKKLKHSLVKALGFQVLASDISLFYDDSFLNDEMATVSSIGIVPGSVIVYKTEVYNEDDDSMEVNRFQEPEIGFAGTMLQLRLDETRSRISSHPPEAPADGPANKIPE